MMQQAEDRQLLTRVVSMMRERFPSRFAENWSPPSSAYDEEVTLSPNNAESAGMKLVSAVGAVWIFLEGFTNESPEDDDSESWALEFCTSVARYGVYVRAGWAGGTLGRRMFVQSTAPKGHESMLYLKPW